MNDIEQLIQAAEHSCHAHGSRLTTKRKQVLIGLIQSQKALSAYELVEFCKTSTGEKMPAMSVYRILDFLQREHLVHKLQLANKYVACVHMDCGHAHAPQFLICQECSKVTEINIQPDTLADINSAVDNAGYHLLSQQIEMNCLCDICSASAAQ